MRSNSFGPAVVESVEPDSAAEETGIRSRDRILAIDGRQLRDVIDFYVLLAVGDVHHLKVERGGRLMRSRWTPLPADSASSSKTRCSEI